MDLSAPRGCILVSQPYLFGASHEDMLEALPAEYRQLPHQPVELEMASLIKKALASNDWSAAKRELTARYNADIAPLIEKHPDYRVFYFGSAPIALAMQLGYLLGTGHAIEPIPHHHEHRTWGWRADNAAAPAAVAPTKLPTAKDRSPGVAAIRVSTSHRVDDRATRASMLETPLVEFEIALTEPSEDAFSSLAEVTAVAKEFRKALDVISDDFTGIERVHLFASVQPSVAVLLGAQISQAMHPPVQTYQYQRDAAPGPTHKPAILIGGRTRPAPPPLSDEERARAATDRSNLQKDLKRLKGLASREPRPHAADATWLSPIFGDAVEQRSPQLGRHWNQLPTLAKTPLPQTSVAIDARGVEDSFCLGADDQWQLDDHWLRTLSTRLPDQDERRSALRLLLLHESVHRGLQGLTRTQSRGIGRFPKVLEEIDYQADVWAMFYEYAHAQSQDPEIVADAKAFFMRLINAATETMWAFDDYGQLLEEIQIRRFNRYLIWYWQYLRIERTAPSSSDSRQTLIDVLDILVDRPVIELAGPAIITREQRIYLSFELPAPAVRELAVYDDGKLYRVGETGSLSIQELLDAVRGRNGAAIRDVLRAAAEQIIR
ncbi:MAG: hypothetical protein Tsb0020_03760 [Haliangiales bacterium]